MVKPHCLEGSCCSISSLTSQLTSAPTYICVPSLLVQVSQSKLAAPALAALAIQISLKLGLKPVSFVRSTVANASKCSWSSNNFPAICPKGHACSKTVTINLGKGGELKPTEAFQQKETRAMSQDALMEAEKQRANNNRGVAQLPAPGSSASSPSSPGETRPCLVLLAVLSRQIPSSAARQQYQ